ncbi:hypothetical protein J6590_047295 [Homalodisca vitripennis]|nr:hypothetical protein J6590_047295 [Homalodisca vitripennis]
MASTSSVVALLLLLALSLVQAQNFFDPDPLPTSSSNVSYVPRKRPPCVLINNYCGKIVPGTGMKKECCGDLICYKNKCRRRTCC